MFGVFKLLLVFGVTALLVWAVTGPGYHVTANAFLVTMVALLIATIVRKSAT